jgi:hypothetical protein
VPPVSEAQRRAMRAAASGHSTLGIPKKVGQEFSKADKGGKLPQRKEGGGAVKGYAKGGDVRVQEDRARGGPSITTRSRFLKTPDVFRTDTERNDYDKTSPGGELSKTTGDTKAQKAIKPRG